MSVQDTNSSTLMLVFMAMSLLINNMGKGLLSKKCSFLPKQGDLAQCGGLTLAGYQVPTKAALSLPSSAGQGRENIMKGSWVEIRTGGDHSAITVTGKTD